ASLDATVAARVLEQLRGLRMERGLSVLLVTHDLGLVAQHCSRVLVLYSGRLVEEAETRSLFRAPRHPYTKGLLSSVPRLTAAAIEKRFSIDRGLFARPQGYLAALRGVSFDVASGETLGLVGESGSGKTTVGRIVARLETPDSGRIRFDGEDWLALSGAALRGLRGRL